MHRLQPILYAPPPQAMTAENIIAIVAILVTGLVGWLAIRRWHIKQRLDSWKATVGASLDQSEDNFRIFTRLHHLMVLMNGVIEDGKMSGDEKKGEIARLIDCLPTDLPSAAAELLDMKLLHLLGNIPLHQLKLLPASEMLSRSIQMRNVLLTTNEKSASDIALLRPTEEFVKITIATRLAARQFAQWQNLVVALDVGYREWLLTRNWFAPLSLKWFKKTKNWDEVCKECTRVSDPEFYKDDDVALEDDH